MPAAPSSLTDPAIGHLLAAAQAVGSDRTQLLVLVLVVVPDPQACHGVRHRLTVILGLAVCAVLADAATVFTDHQIEPDPERVEHVSKDNAEPFLVGQTLPVFSRVVPIGNHEGRDTVAELPGHCENFDVESPSKQLDATKEFFGYVCLENFESAPRILDRYHE